MPLVWFDFVVVEPGIHRFGQHSEIFIHARRHRHIPSPNNVAPRSIPSRMDKAEEPLGS